MKTTFKKSCTVILACLTCIAAQAQQPVNLTNRWTAENIVLANGEPSLSKTTGDTWIIEKTTEEKYVRIKNAATGGYLNTEKGPLAAGEIGMGWYSAQWVLIPAGPYMQIVNRWRQTYINNQNGKLEATALGAPGWWSAQWTLAPASSLISSVPISPVPAGSDGEISMGDNSGSMAFPEPFSATNESSFYKISIAGELMRTSDGGHNWKPVNKKLATLSVTLDGSVWGTSFQDEALLSTSGGESWVMVGANYTQVSGTDNTGAWAVTAQGDIFKTVDQGRNWQAITTAHATKISAVSKTVAWALYADSVRRTTDGGATWASGIKLLKQVSAIDYNTAWAIGANGELFLTTNGGQSWLKYPGDDAYFNSCAALSATSAFVVDKNLKLVKVNAAYMK